MLLSKMWHDLNQAVLKKQPKWLFFPANDQGASSAATKSCHSNKNRLTTPLTTYGKFYREALVCKAFSF